MPNQVRRYKERIAALEQLQEIARSLASELNLDPLLKKILRSAVDVMGAQAGSLLLYDRNANELVFEVVEGGAGETLLHTRMPTTQGIAGWTFTRGQPLIVRDVHQDDRFYRQIDESLGHLTSSLISVPLISKGETLGVLQVLNKKSGEGFTADDLDILTTFAAQSATAIENARLYTEVLGERDRVLAVEEEVRKELARDLHDGPAQLLAAVIMNLRFIEELLEGDPEQGRSELAFVEKLSSRALGQVRGMIFDLRPVILETKGLVPAIESYVQRYRDEGGEGMQVSFHADSVEHRLPRKAEGLAFAIIREAVSNAQRHARASEVVLELREKGGEIEVRIRDNGKGFDVAQVEATYGDRGSLGLLNMRERAEAMGGTLRIESDAGEGTTVILRVPGGEQAVRREPETTPAGQREG